MALTLTLLSDAYQIIGKLRMAVFDILLDNNYPAGGYTINATDVGLSAIYGAHFIGGSVAGLGFVPYWFLSGTGGKLLVNSSGGGVEQLALYHMLAADAEVAAAENTDQAGAPTNSTVIGTAETFTTMAGNTPNKSKTITLQPDVCRNLQITILNNTGGNLNLFQGVTTFTVTGKFRGAPQTDLITFTSTGGNKSVGHTPNYRWKAGVKPFDTISLISYDNAPDAALTCTVGPGTRFGLPCETANNVEADIVKIWKGLPSVTADADVPVAGTFSGANKTVNIGLIAAFQGLGVFYKTSNQLSAGTDLSAQTVRVMFMGL